jgi:hypothetical protein
MYRPATIAHPLYQRQSSWVGHRALNPDDQNLPEVPNAIRKLEAMPVVSKRSEDAVRMLQECFQITLVQNRSKKRM